MAAVQDRAHDGTGLTGDLSRAACSGRKRPRTLPGKASVRATNQHSSNDTSSSKDALNDHRMRKEAT